MTDTHTTTQERSASLLDREALLTRLLGNARYHARQYEQIAAIHRATEDRLAAELEEIRAELYGTGGLV